MGSAEAQVLTTRPYLAPPLIALVAANCTPIFGVLVLGWDVFPILLLFWFENVIIGGVNVLRMVSAAPANPVAWIGKVFLVPFFCVHYGVFCLVHGIFVISFFGRGVMPSGSFFPAAALLGFIAANRLQWAILGILASHLVSFGYNFIGLGEYKRASLNDLMSQPYSRVIVLHLTILFGGFAVMALKSPAGALVLLVVLKTALDVRAHVKERRKFAEAGTGQREPAPMW